MPIKVWDGITYPFQTSRRSRGSLEWLSKFIPHFIMGAITYPCFNLINFKLKILPLKTLSTRAAMYVNTLKPRQNGRSFAEGISELISLIKTWHCFRPVSYMHKVMISYISQDEYVYVEFMSYCVINYTFQQHFVFNVYILMCWVHRLPIKCPFMTSRVALWRHNYILPHYPDSTVICETLSLSMLRI